MARTSDLDNIAPDDINLNNSTPTPSSQPQPTKPDKKPKKVKQPKSDSTQKQSSQLPYRQKVYELIKNKTKNSFSSFLARPKVFDFDQRDTGEEIILVLRRHWFTNLGWILTAIVMLLTPIALTIFPIFESFPLNYQIIAIMFWYLLTFIFAFESFLSWYFNVFILTEERVFDIDFNNLLVKEISEAKINMIQDVTYSVIGLAQTLLNYGTVQIQTAAEIPEILLEKIPNPELVAKILQQMRLEEEQEALDGRIR